VSADGNGAVAVEEVPAPRSYGAGARILSIGIASTGVFSFLYLAFASHVLSGPAYGRISLLWSIMFVILSVIYRPIEQLLSRTIADRRARGLHHAHPLRVPALIQAGFALVFVVAALALHDQLVDHVFDGSSALYWVLVIGVSAYAASYFARGWLAGHQRFGLYGGLVLMESTSRFVFALAAAVGIAHGQTAVAIGMAVAPFVSLVVVPLAFSRASKGRDPELAGVAVADAAREGPAHAQIEEATGDLSMRHGARFAVAVFGIMLAEQTLVNAAVIAINATSGRVLAGFVFNVLLIVRAPLQLFQAIQTSLLPHLAGLEATESEEGFARAIRLTVLAISAFAGACAIGLLAIGPFVMGVVFGHHGFHYGRGRDGAAPDRGDVESGRARPRPRGARRRRVAAVRGPVRGLGRLADDGRRGAPHRGRLFRRRARALRAALRALPAPGRRRLEE
jgi:O-antigen/teichoic acid export membrane protein